MQLIPNLIKPDELDHDFIFSESLHVRLDIILFCVLPSSQLITLLYLNISITLFFLMTF
jgi:hypothetical protein